jgi:hypothetical protein
MKTSCLKPAIVAAALAAVCSCGGMGAMMGDYGRFVQDPVAAENFQKPVLNPDYNYYFYGPGDFPDVLLGIDKKYSLAPGVFNTVTLTPESMKSLVGNMRHRAASNGDLLSGFNIVDGQGNKIGQWYGPFMFRSVVQVRDGVVSISYPDFPNRPFDKPEPESDVN